MITQDKTLFKKAMANPAEVFDSPMELSNDNRFSFDQKLKILESWALDEKALLRAESENMGSGTNKPKASSLLKIINNAKLQINASNSRE